MTLDDLKTALSKLDEVTLMEILDLHTDEIIARFNDVIEAKYEQLQYKVEDPREYQREEERFEPLSGELSWKTSYQASLDLDDFDE